jgi:hypothetical protein
MRILTYPETDSANIVLEMPAPGRTVELRDDVIATVENGRLTSLELLGVSRYGDTFDEAVATRLLDWAREQLVRPEAS